MAKIKITIEDDDGNVIGTDDYSLDTGKDTINDIEKAVESFRKDALPNIERKLSIEAQDRFDKSKKILLKHNGKCNKIIKTMHGRFTMSVNKYRKGKQHLDYFDLTSQFQKGNHITAGLTELLCYYSNRLSFREVEDLLTRITGTKILSSGEIDIDLIVSEEMNIKRIITSIMTKTSSVSTI